MADPARKLPEFAEATDPKMVDPRYPNAQATDPVQRPLDPANQSVDRKVVETRGAGNGAIIAAVVVVLAILAYVFLAPSTVEAPAPGEATTTEPASQPAAQPDGSAPASPPAAAPAPATPPTNEAPAAPAAPAQPAPAN